MGYFFIKQEDIVDMPELRKEKQRLENDLGTFINDRLNSFRIAAGGVSVNHITVNMIDVTEFGDREPRYILGPVTCEIAI